MLNRTRILSIVVLACVLVNSGYACAVQTQSQANIQSAFGDKPVIINDYNDQLKVVLVSDAKVYFATHDGRYIFAGPIFDTQLKTNIVTLQENQLRRAYLSAVPESVFVRYPSTSPSKYQITVFTDIDCGYCRKFHSNMRGLNEQGISVNYIMLPRSGAGSPSHTKTMAVLCSNSPAEAITRAMQNDNPKPNGCKGKVMSQHMDIVRDLAINNTPTIVLPNGQLRLGSISPGELIALLKSSK